MQGYTMNDPAVRKVVLGYLLDDLANRMGGVLDVWTNICMLATFQPVEFVAWQTKVLKAKCVVIQAEATLADQRTETRAAAKTLVDECERMCDAFATLAEYLRHESEQIDAAVETVRETYRSICTALHFIGAMLGHTVVLLENQTTDTREYYERILDSLDWKFSGANAHRDALTPV